MSDLAPQTCFQRQHICLDFLLIDLFFKQRDPKGLRFLQTICFIMFFRQLRCRCVDLFSAVDENWRS